MVKPGAGLSQDLSSEKTAPIKAKVLLVDDCETELENLESILGDLGEPLVRARSGQEALAALCEGDFALATLDVRMGDMDGFEVARLIRSQRRLRSLPIMFISALDPARETLERAYALGAVDFISKPLIPSAVRSKARVFVDLFKREREARRSQSRYESISELSPVGQFLTDSGGHFLWVNELWCHIAGLAPSNALGHGWSNAIHPEDRDRIFEDWYRSTREGAPFRSEYRFLTSDGVVTWVLGQAKTERDPRGRTLGYIGTITDITERKEVEARLTRTAEAAVRELRGRTQELEAVMDYVPAAIWITKDPEGKVIVGNKRSYELLAMSQGESVSKSSPQGDAATPYDAYIEGRRARPEDLPIQRSGTTGQPVFGHEQEIRGPRGRSRWVYGNAVPLLDEEGNVKQVVAAFVDVTERKQSERDRAFLASLVESSEDAIIGLDLAGAITSWNQGAERLFGYRVADAVGRPFSILIPDDFRETGAEILQRVRDNKKVDQYETRRKRGDGTSVDVSVTVSPIRDERGEIIGASQIIRDISERKRADEEIRRMNADLERRVLERTRELRDALDELDAFSGTAAHDLRAPLRAISSLSSLLSQDYSHQFDENARTYMQRISAACQRMSTLIDSLLGYSRLRNSQIELAPIDLEVLTRDIVTQVIGDQVAQNAKVEIRSPLPVVLGHHLLLTQVLTNLLSNSIKFVAPGTDPRIEIAADHRGALARLAVRDNGIGIAEGNFSRLFRPFDRLPGAEGYPGVGLGLAIVKRAVERMGGRIGAESEPGRGSTFWVELPKA